MCMMISEWREPPIQIYLHEFFFWFCFGKKKNTYVRMYTPPSAGKMVKICFFFKVEAKFRRLLMSIYLFIMKTATTKQHSSLSSSYIGRSRHSWRSLGSNTFHWHGCGNPWSTQARLTRTFSEFKRFSKKKAKQNKSEREQRAERGRGERSPHRTHTHIKYYAKYFA